MIYPKEFYYTEAQSGKQYQQRPAGIPDVMRLVEGKPCWISPSPPREQKKKKLILADWTGASWSNTKITGANIALEHLIDEGFDIYFWQDGQLKPLTKANLSCINDKKAREVMVPDSMETITHAAATQHHLAHDELFVLDDYWVNHLLTESDVLQPRSMSLRALSFVPVEKRDNILRFIKEAKPELKSVLIDVYCSVESNLTDTYSYLRAKLPNKIAISRQHKTAYLGASDIHILLERNLLTALDGLTFGLSELANIQVLQFTSDVMGADLQILRSTPKLQTLNLSCTTSLSGNITLDPGSLPCLNHVAASESGIWSSGLRGLCIAAPHLQLLSLVSCINLSGELSLEPKSLLDLQTLELTNSNLSDTNLRNLYLAAPNLKALYINRCFSLTEGFLFEPGSLLGLELVSVSSQISTAGLLSLFKAAPNLKKFVSTECKNIPSELLPKELLLLEEVELKHSEITASGLQTLLEAAPNTKILDLTECYNLLTGELVLRPNSLNHLEKITLTSSNITASGLQTLLSAAPHLKSLDLQSCDNLFPFVSTLAPGSLADLESIDLSNSNITAPGLQTLLAAAPNLKLLDLTKCKSISDNILLLPGSLKHLEKITLNWSNISASGLQALLSAAPHLKHIEMDPCLILPPFVSTLVPGSLADLESIDLADSINPTIVIQTLLAAAPNLKQLNLSSAPISDDLFLHPKSLNLLEQITLNYSKITTSVLQSLLEAAPHVKSIDAHHCSKLSGSLTPAPDSLLNLESINFEYSKITVSSLETLFAAAPNLKKLNLMSCTNLVEILSLEPGSLRYLEDITLTNSDITIGNIQVLSEAAPKLDVAKMLNEIYAAEASSIWTRVMNETQSSEAAWAAVNAAEEAKLIALYAPPRAETIEEAPLPGSESLLSPGSESPLSPRATAASSLTATKEKKTSAGQAASAPDSLSTTESLDADTAPDPTKTFNLDRIFFPVDHTYVPHVSCYRMNAFQRAEVNTSICSLTDAFILKKEGDLGLIEPPSLIKSTTNTIKEKIEGQSFYGKQKLVLKPNQWQALASLSPQEKMLYYHTAPAADVEIKYSTRDNIYYIRSKIPRSITIDFRLQVPEEEPALPAKIQTIVDDFSSYQAEALELDKDKTSFTGQDYLDAIEKQRKGACRHRAFVFKKKMEKEHTDIPTRIITNNCHSFAEIKVGDKWLPCNLGGYAAKLTINESKKPHIAPHEALVTHTVVHAPTTAPHSPGQKAIAEFEGMLKTWEKIISVTATPIEYYQQCVTGEIKSRLIECLTARDVDAVHYGLQAYCRSTSRPVFYIHSPDDLNCSAPYMYRRDDNTGELKRGPGGALHHFLTTHTNGVVVVNYGTFKTDDIVRFNALLDKERKADGTDVPPETVVIGLFNKDNTTSTPGSDFYSRFKKVETCPIASEELASAIPKLPDATPDDATASYAINLYHASDWEERLLGRWVPDNGSWTYEEGELQRAFAKGVTTIDLQNGLWKNKDFCRFWQEAQQTGVIQHGSHIIPLPTGINFTRSERYDWKKLIPCFQQETTLSDASHAALNPASLGNFFSQYQVTDTNQLNRTQGLIQAAKDTVPPTLYVHVTRQLSDDEWAMLLDKCRTEKVKLVAYCAFGVELPGVLQAKDFDPLIRPGGHLLPEGEGKPWVRAVSETTSVIQSTDVDTTLAQLTHDHPGCLVIDVSECHDTDLIASTNGSLINIKGEALRLEFSHSKCAVSTALEKGLTVILKGRCSTALADELAPILLQRSTQKTPLGKLIIASNDTTGFHYLPQYTHTVTIEEKRAVFEVEHKVLPSVIEPYLAKEPLSTIATRFRFVEKSPQLSSDLSWAGLRSLPDATKDPGVLSDSKTSLAAAASFTKDRVDAVNDVLSREPYVFLTGLSGVGKSTFVTHELCQPSDTLYQGEPALLTWARDTTRGKRKLLFIDEANLSPSDWTAFEGLFNHPPGILIDGQYYPLSETHKVIFAGNPLSYGDERKLASFFERHGNAVVFEPFPSTVLFENILKPVFKDTVISESSAAKVSGHLLNVYRYLCLCSKTDLLISPRELQMMALLTVSHCSRQEPPQDAEEVAKYFAWHIAKPLAPAEKLDEFKRMFEPTTTLAEVKSPSASDFLITPSRQHIIQMLDEFLALREIRNEAQENEAQRYGGLGGLILDGEPGIGKSELVISALRARGYEEQHDFAAPTSTDKAFYRMPVSMALAEKETLLRKAFDEGSVVIIDEINSSPMMERLLNALLMGTTPEGARPKNPGFMVIGTQNPISMGGRRAPSTALSRRMTTLELPPYSAEEMCEILLKKGLDADTSDAMVKAYQTQTAYAELHHLSPSPNFRNLMTLEEQILLGRKRSPVTPASPEGKSPPAQATGEGFAPAADAILVQPKPIAALKIPEAEPVAEPVISTPAESEKDDTKTGLQINFFQPESPAETNSEPRPSGSGTQSSETKQMEISTLYTKYFGSDPTALGGVFKAYLTERHKTYWFKDFTGQYAALLFGCFGYKTDQTAREEYLDKLQEWTYGYKTSCVANYSNSESYYYICKEILNAGLKKFPPRAQEGQDGYEQSLHFKLKEFRTELESIHNRPSPNPDGTYLNM